MNRAELKSAAKEQIRGKIGILFIITLIIFVISFVTSLLGLIPLVGLVVSFVVSFVVSPALTLSLVRIYLSVTDGNTPVVGDTFSGFNDFWSSFKVTFLTGLFTSLWMLLLVIPGIIKAFSYSMAMYILAENPGKPALECINESKELTQGHKMELFVLGLSFFGWGLLCIVTLGIAAIWVTPYMSTTMANTYRWLKREAGKA